MTATTTQTLLDVLNELYKGAHTTTAVGHSIPEVSVCVFVCSGPVLALVLAREDAVQHWRNILGPADVSQAKVEDPDW